MESVYSSLMICAGILLILSPDFGLFYQLNIDVSYQDQGSFQSVHFPVNCCEPQIFVLHYDDQPSLTAAGQTRLLLTFDDLDLPPESTFKIYDWGELNLNDQPRYRLGQWHRPFINSSGDHVQLVLNPPRTVGLHDNPSPSHYTGFKVAYHNSPDHAAYQRHTDELCPPVVSPLEGAGVKVKFHSRFQGQYVDCVWQLKPSGGSTSRTQPGQTYQVYVRLDHLDLLSTAQKSLFELRRGLTSESDLIASATRLMHLHQSPQGFMSSQGFYLRLVAPAYIVAQEFSFVYGIVRIRDKSEEECSPDFSCRPSQENWCIPAHHMCNGWQNCPEGEDELYCNKSAFVAMDSGGYHGNISKERCELSETLNIPCANGRCASDNAHCDYAYTLSCGDLYQACPDASCKDFSTNCTECQSYQRKCEDGKCLSLRYLCDEDPCELEDKVKCADQRECHYESDRCDYNVDCEDGSDEDDCLWEEEPEFIIVMTIVSVMVFICQACCAVLCWRKCCKQKRGAARRLGNTTSCASGDTQPTYIPLGTLGPRVPTPQPPAYDETTAPPSYATVVGIPELNALVNVDSNYNRSNLSIHSSSSDSLVGMVTDTGKR